MTENVTIELNIERNEMSRIFYVSNLRDWDPILGQTSLATLNVIMDAKNNKVSIQPTGKPRLQLHMEQKPSHAVSTAACSIYDYDDHTAYYSFLHAPERDTEDEEAQFARYQDASAAQIQSCMYCLPKSQSVSTNPVQLTSGEEKIFTESLYNLDSNSSTPEA